VAVLGSPVLVSIVQGFTVRTMSNSTHYKTIKRAHEPGDCHELTFSCNQRAPLFDEDRYGWFSESLTNALEFCRLKLVAFVFMPEHVHLIVYPDDPAEAQISRFLKAVKQPLSAKVRGSMIARGDPLLERLTVKRRTGRVGFRFWQQGPGYDRNLYSVAAVLARISHHATVEKGV